MDLSIMMIKGGFKYCNENHEKDPENETETEAKCNIGEYLNHVNLELYLSDIILFLTKTIPYGRTTIQYE